MIKWCRERQITLNHGSPYTPTTGAVKRFNQTLLQKLRRLTNFRKKNWKDWVEKVTKGYNSSWSRAINCASWELKAKNFSM